MRGRGRPKHPDILTPREWEVLELLREHRTNEQIAGALGVSLATARFHVSEILGKLGVTSREEAAVWQPSPERRAWLLAPLALLRRTTTLGTTARIAAGGTLALAAAGIALLAWGVFRTSGHASRDEGDSRPGTVAWTVDQRDYGVASIIVFDTQAREAHRIQMPSNVGFSEWLKPGHTFAGFDVDGSAYNVYGVDGTKVRALFPMHLPTDHYIARSYDGHDAVVTRSGGVDVLDTDTGTVVESIPNALAAWASPDGTMLAYTITDPPGALPANAHSVLLNVADRKASGPQFVLPGRTILTRTTAANKYEGFGFAYHPWSPDGRYLAIDSTSNANSHILQSIQVLTLDGTVAWSSSSAPTLVFATWDGPHTLVSAPIVDTRVSDRSTGAVSVDVATASLSHVVTSQLTVTAAYSPDGQYAVQLEGSPMTGSQTCELLDTSTGKTLAQFDATEADRVANFCSTVSWSADSRFALVSRRGG